MDIKVEGITIEIMTQALAQAKEGRIHILNKMVAGCPKPKQSFQPMRRALKLSSSSLAKSRL